MKLVLAPCGNYYHPEGEPRTKYDRVSSVVELIPQGDGLYYSGLTDCAQASAQAFSDALHGECPHYTVEPEDLAEWVQNPNWETLKKVTLRRRQGYADRGTLTDLFFKEIMETGPMTGKEIEDWINDQYAERNEEVSLAKREWEQAQEMGLPVGNYPPEFRYFCTEDEVLSYCTALNTWWTEDTGFAPLLETRGAKVAHESQRFAGEIDVAGEYAGMTVVADLKTSKSAQPTLRHQSQLAAYTAAKPTEVEFRATGAINIMVSPEKVSVRLLSQDGLMAGWQRFHLALQLLQTGTSMKGAYISASQTHKRAMEAVA